MSAGDAAAGPADGRRRPQVAAPDPGDQQAALDALQSGWGGAYAIECYAGVAPEEWVAFRRDDGTRLASPLAEGLRKLIQDDYAGRPVPRDVAP